MDAEKLALFEKCYRNWNGTSVMEGAFKELLGEVQLMTARAANAERLILDNKPRTAIAALRGTYDN